MKNKVLIFVQIISAVIFITAVICIIRDIKVYKEDQKSYSDLNNIVIHAVIDDEKRESDNENEKVQSDVISGKENISIDFSRLNEINDDCVGWIVACGERINYPIVVSESQDYYLKHGFDKNSNKSGCIFIYDNKETRDTQSVFDEYNCIIYGHNMKDGSMFHELTKYKDESYLKNNSNIKIFDPDGNVLYYEVFASYYMDAEKLKIYYNSNDRDERQKYINSINQYCISKPNVDDKIITLITCEYSGSNNRMVVNAKKIEKP